MSMIGRIHSRKDWKAQFEKRLTANNSRLAVTQKAQQQIDDATAVVDKTIASKFIQELLGSTSDGPDKVTMKTMCRHNLENIVPPSDPIPWRKSWGSQILCDICDKPSITDCTVCKKCNSIAHNQCIIKSGLFVQNYECPECVDSIQSEIDHYEKLLIHLKNERRIERDAFKISKRLVILVEKKRLARKRRSVILLQSVVRRYLARKKYIRWLRAQLRLVSVRLTHLPKGMIENGVVVLTVHDTMQNTQSFRLDATAEEALKQGFLIPGVGANLSILLTLAHKEESVDGRRQYVMLGQAQLALRDVVEFTKKNKFDINFLEKIKWPPTETKGAFKYHLTTYANYAAACGQAAGLGGGLGIGQQLTGGSSYFSSGASVAGSLGSASMFPPIHSHSHSHNNNLIRNSNYSSLPGSPGGGSIFSSNTSVVSNLNTVSSFTAASMYGAGSVNNNNNNSLAASGVTYSSNPIARALFATDRLCSMFYYPQNPVINMVAMCSGPPLDILRRASELGIKKVKSMHSGANYRNSRYWLCLYRLKLVFFQYYGDILPRLVADISQATAVVLLDSKGRKTPLVNIVHADMRTWLLEFDSRKEATMFEFALLESRKACEHASIYAQKSEIMSPDGQFDFKVATIY